MSAPQDPTAETVPAPSAEAPPPAPPPTAAADAPVATTPSQTGEVKGAKPPVQGCIDAHSAFVHYLYQPHGATYDDNVAKIETSTGVKREHIAYAITAILGLYLIAGNSAQFVCNLIGFAYPAYASVKAVRTEDKSDDTQWLIYWTVFAFFSLIDFFAIGIMSWFPIYWLSKAAFLVYLYLPQTMGAQTIYAKVVDPLVKKIDELIEGRKKV